MISGEKTAEDGNMQRRELALLLPLILSLGFGACTTGQLAPDTDEGNSDTQSDLEAAEEPF